MEQNIRISFIVERVSFYRRGFLQLHVMYFLYGQKPHKAGSVFLVLQDGKNGDTFYIFCKEVG